MPWCFPPPRLQIRKAIVKWLQNNANYAVRETSTGRVISRLIDFLEVCPSSLTLSCACVCACLCLTCLTCAADRLSSYVERLLFVHEQGQELGVRHPMHFSARAAST
jgi:hypothetical protein